MRSTSAWAPEFAIRVGRVLTTVGILLLCSPALAIARDPAPSAEDIIRNSVEANERDWRAAPEYAYTETTKDGNSSKTERVVPLYGSPYRRLIKVNGKPLSPDEQKREEEKFQEAASRRRSESQQEKAERIKDYEKDRRRDHLMMSQLTAAFTFSLTGEKRLSGHHVYTLRATPRAGYDPPNYEARVLTGMKGQLWIDKSTFQWVKVLAEVISPVTIGGFLASVEPGTYFELEKMPVEGNIWLPSHFSVRSHSKVLMLFNHATQEDDTFFNYTKAPSP